MRGIAGGLLPRADADRVARVGFGIAEGNRLTRGIRGPLVSARGTDCRSPLSRAFPVSPSLNLPIPPSGPDPCGRGKKSPI